MRSNSFCFLLYFLLIFSVNVFAQDKAQLLALTLKNPDNNEFQFSRLKESKATVLVFFLTDCPASQNYTLTINKLQKKYAGKNISFKIVFPDTYSTNEEIRKFIMNYKMTMPVLLDPELKLTRILQAQVAPQCFLLDSTGTVVYDGRIDDWYYKPGKKRTVIVSHDLDKAITNFISGKEIVPAKTIPIGCIINY